LSVSKISKRRLPQRRKAHNETKFEARNPKQIQMTEKAKIKTN
jgi:hypothetical protein